MAKYVLEFSGGRDSLAVLKLWESRKADTTVLWLNAGGTLPEVRELIFQHTKGWDLREVRTDAAGWISKHGYPADVVPVWHTAHGAKTAGNSSPRITPALSCCLENIMKPMQLAAMALNPEFIVRGQRTAEQYKSPARSGYKFNNITLLFPIEDWSDEQVNDYLVANGVVLPEWYQYGTKGFDCWWCTGFAKESRGLHQYLEKYHPKKFQEVQRRFTVIESAIKSELWF
jgi:phosphoadenosine phosphosulfate reductase